MMSSYIPSLRKRSGSVGRGDRDSGSSNIRSYGPRDLPKPVSRMSRASSYDPFSTRSNMSTSMTSSYSRPSYYSNLTSMSHSYHPDYTSRSLSKRFGSSDQLNSSAYKSPYSSSNFSKYRPPEGNRERSSYRASSTFSPRTPLPSSDSRRERDFSSSSRDFPSISLSKYRPDSSSYSFSTNSYSRPTSSYTASASCASTYKPRVRIEYRSKTPGVSNSSTSEVRLSRYDRDVRSLCPIEKSYVSEDAKSVDDVEKTFRKLYNRYVKDINEKTDEDYAESSTKPISVDKLTSKIDTLMIETSMADIETDQEAESKTPRASPVDVTPKASPKLKKKEISDVINVPKTEKKNSLIDIDSSPKTESSKEIFERAHEDVLMKPAVIPTRKLKPAASAMDKLLRKDSLTIKLTDAIDKKKTTPESTTKNDSVINSKASSELSKSTTNLVANLSCPKETALKVPAKLSKSLSPAPTHSSAQLTSKRDSEMKLPLSTSAKTSSSPSKASSSTSLASSVTSSSLLNTTETTPGKSSSEDSEISGKPTKPSTSVTKTSCQQTIKKKPDLTINVSSAEVPSTELTFFSPKSVRSRSSSPLTKTERSKSNLTVNGLKVKEMRRSISPSTTSTLEVKREERAHSEDSNEKKATKKKRDLTRTLENLKEKLEDEQRKQQDEAVGKVMDVEVEPKQSVRPPLLLLTQPSMPSTPVTTTGTILWNSDPNIEYTDEEWTEEDEADYESDSEFTISQTFKIPDRLPIGDLYPLQSPASSRCSPFASDYDSDSSPPFLAVQNESADYRGRVGQKFAVPPPTFTCSVSYDGQEAWNSDEDGSVHSCQDFDDIYTGRPTSSGLAYLTPSDEEESIYDEESVAVGCTLKLVDRAARRDDGDYTDDSEYYDDEEFTDEEYWDEDEEYDEEFEYSDEEEADLSECENSEMHSICDSPELIPISADLQEEALEFEEADAEFEMDATFLHASPKEVTPDVTGADKHREVTYTKDMTVLTVEEEASNLNIGEDKLTKAKTKRITKDGRTEKADKSLISSCVIPAEEVVSEATFTELPSDTLLEASLREHEETIGLMEVNVIPTFVKPQTEKVKEESTSRFSDRKPSTDFARKAVIQPNKLETAKVQKVETKIGERPKPAVVENKTQSMEQPSKAKEAIVKTKLPEVKSGTSKERSTVEAAVADKPKNMKEVEDKSILRKSALNMSQEEAKKKAKADEEAAKTKARRFGTVSALMDKFKEDPRPPEPIIYKRSSRLAAKEAQERPRRKYEIVKPVINDEFDKQMEEIRAKMKAGSSQLQDQMKNLSKGISTTAEEVKKRELEEKHKHLLDKASGVFSEADKEKMRWKERRDAETEAELAKIESSKGARAAKQEVVEKMQEGSEKKEPKRTVRKIVRDKSPVKENTEKVEQRNINETGASSLLTTQAPVRNMAERTSRSDTNTTANKKLCESTTEKTEPPSPTVPKDIFRREKNPVVKPADTIKKPVAPKQSFIVDESNFDLLQAATKVATRRRKSLVELKEQKEKTNDQKAVSPSRSKTEGAVSPKLGPKGEGAAATKIRNTLGNVVNVQTDSKSPAGSEKSTSSRRYGARRKTQEIVNESQQPKRKRKEQHRKNKFIGDPHDIDILFGWEKENTFEKMERMFQTATSDRMNTSCTSGKKRRIATKIWISDLTDIDKIYKPSEIRDITASVDM